MLKVSVFAVCLLALARPGAGTPTGACPLSCDNMTPMHQGLEPQPLPSPYTITLSQMRVQPRADVTVTIAAATNDFFRGFLVQARDSSDTPVGTFEVSADVRTLDCLGGMQNAATHVINSNKTLLEIGWVAPSTPTDVTFLVSTVREVTTFWVKEPFTLTVALD